MRRRFGGRGFTLVELLVVIAIIGILVALLLPAIQAAREAARRTQCNNNLKNISLGLQNYHDTYKTFPMGAMHGGLRGGTTYQGPSWQYGVLPFMEQRNIYDKIANLTRSGATGTGIPLQAFAAVGVNANVAGRPLDKLIPDYMRCPSSPLPVMEAQTGTICLSTYVGIAGGTDILTNASANTTLYPNPNLLGAPYSSTRTYNNRAGVTMSFTSGGQNCVITSSGMLPIAQHVGMQGCTDGTSNTMIVGEQSDWLRDVNRTVSTKYHGDPGWAGTGATGTDGGGGWLTGTNCVPQIPDQIWTTTDVAGTPAWSASTNGAVAGARIFNVTTVRYKPYVKEVLGAGAAPGCAEIMGLNNPLQAAHPGGLLVAFVDGSVQFISSTTDLAVLLRIAIRDDGQTVKIN